ncbi:carboxy terminal-processing peptidase [Bythopirellula polymerisocia]|uniref:Tail-specific protease n=1 Tax=Bythopirellula polymerisocia TaxID=2528003 RepID=A0A5C6CPI5_9BACT|nr:carboxy terminal-processing peptidase [Bythopirellula polymerisocia]TWU24659.1 Tail-specific protease precursor [Bythopirellula polymerisocia]
MLFDGERFGLSRQSRNMVLVLLAIVCSVVGLSVPTVVARPTDPTRVDRHIAIMVAALMDRRHLSEMQMNDEISHRALDMFLKSLDRMKLFFLQSDVDEFMAERDNLDDYVKAGDVRIAKRIFDRFLERVNERVAVAQEYIDAEHDFSLDETMIRDPEKWDYAKTEEELNERWRKRVKYDLLLEIADEVPHDEAVEKLHKRYRGIQRNWEQHSNDELLEDFLTAITTSFDPHSSYMSPSNLDNFTIQMRLELDGIGASLESKYGETIVRRIVPGGAADKDGRLKIEDVIVGVAEGKEGEFVDIVDMKINDVVQLIRGKPNTIVRLEVMPADKSGRKIYDITRARIELKDSEARSEILDRPVTMPKADEPTVPGDHTHVLDSTPLVSEPVEEVTGKILEQQKGPNGPARRIGVISLPSFYMDMEGRRAGKADFKSTTRDVRRLLEEFNQQNVDLVVMDLRFNGGGSLPESVEATGLFIDKGPVVQVKGPDGRVQPYPDEEAGEVWSGPLIVLINRFSASASEIFAGAIQDYGRGLIIGDKSTHGKGTVQQLFELGTQILPLQEAPNLGALKMTIQQFYRPSGDSTQNRGVVSDVEIPYRTSHWEGIGEADLDYALKFDQVAPQPHDNYRAVTAPMVEQLRQRSAAREAKTDFFIKEDQKIKEIVKRQQEPTVTLNKEKFLAERAEVNSDKDQEEMFENLENNDRPVFPMTPYNEEVMAIALDYLELLNEANVALAK